MALKLRKVISGGQTGADREGLEGARACGLETGGYAPKGYRTEVGRDLSLKDFHLQETETTDYAPRTRLNVQEADVTLWFGNLGSPGYQCTRNAAIALNKPFIENPIPEQVLALADMYEVWNVAGNRKSKNPAVVAQVREAFKTLQGKL